MASIRLKGWDYSSYSWYFITLVTCNRSPLFGSYKSDMMLLNSIGKIVCGMLVESEKIRKELSIDCFCIQPNHLHAIVIIDPMDSNNRYITVGSNGRLNLHNSPTTYDRLNLHNSPTTYVRLNLHNSSTTNVHLTLPPKSLGSFVSGFKSRATTMINQYRKTPHIPVWQRNYYERIIRNDKALQAIRNYIAMNTEHHCSKIDPRENYYL